MLSEDPEQDEDLDALYEEIAPEVMGVLSREEFFTFLERRIFPNGTMNPNMCSHSFLQTLDLLAGLGHDSEAQDDVLHVMRLRGGFCDCEIVLNAAPESAVREAHWKSRAADAK